MTTSSMNERDIRAVIAWFKGYVKHLETLPYYHGLREGENRMSGFIVVMQKELDNAKQA